MLAVLYFAWVRERIGTGEEQVEPPAHVATVAALAGWLAEQGEGHSAAFSDLSRIRAAVDQQFSSLDAPIGNAREIAFFPPVTGG